MHKEEGYQKAFFILILSLILLNLLDLLTTYLGILAGGHEANPFMAIMLQQSWGHMIFAKVISTMFVAFILYFAWVWVKEMKNDSDKTIGLICILSTTFILSALMLFTIINNIQVIIEGYMWN
jgi:hypothetical protein